MNKQQTVSTPTRALALVPPLAEQEPEPTLTELVIRLEVDLKPERVQEPEVLAAAAQSGSGFALALTVRQSQPVTIELSEPQVTFTFHGPAAGAANGGGLAATA
jgi:hypothetical protein